MPSFFYRQKSGYYTAERTILGRTVNFTITPDFKVQIIVRNKKYLEKHLQNLAEAVAYAKRWVQVVKATGSFDDVKANTPRNLRPVLPGRVLLRSNDPRSKAERALEALQKGDDVEISSSDVLTALRRLANERNVEVQWWQERDDKTMIFDSSNIDSCMPNEVECKPIRATTRKIQ